MEVDDGACKQLLLRELSVRDAETNNVNSHRWKPATLTLGGPNTQKALSGKYWWPLLTSCAFLPPLLPPLVQRQGLSGMAGKPLAVAIDVDGSLSHSSKETELHDFKGSPPGPLGRDELIRIDADKQPPCVFTTSGAGLQMTIAFQVSVCLVSTRFRRKHVMPQIFQLGKR
eukprot:1076521-Pelagomonas_calceolata.AAC.2